MDASLPLSRRADVSPSFPSSRAFFSPSFLTLSKMLQLFPSEERISRLPLERVPDFLFARLSQVLGEPFLSSRSPFRPEDSLLPSAKGAATARAFSPCGPSFPLLGQEDGLGPFRREQDAAPGRPLR